MQTDFAQRLPNLPHNLTPNEKAECHADGIKHTFEG